MDLCTTKMLINIDIKTTDFIHEYRSKDIYVFTEIARVSREGYHRFIVSRTLSKEIKKLLSDQEHIYQYDRLGGKYTTSGYVANPSIPILELEYGSKPLDKISENRWRIGHFQLIDNRFHEQTVLLCEGYSDCDFYEFLFNCCAMRKDFGVINFDAHQTGGSGNMKRGIIHHSKGRIVLCILDSDKKTPFDNPSESYKIAKKFLEKMKLIGYVTFTPGRETENFLPIKIAESISSDENKKHTSNLIELIEKQGPQDSLGSLDCLSNYYDFKEGFKQSAIEKFNKSTNKNSKEWIERKYTFKVTCGCRIIPFSIKWIERRFVTRVIEKELPSYGKNIVELFVGNDKAKEQFIKEMDGTFWKLHFDSWFDEFCWYLCGEEKQRP